MTGDANLVHPDREQLDTFVHGKLPPDEQQRIEEHLAQCDSCCETLRDIPHDDLIERMRGGDTAPSIGETALISSDSSSEKPAEVKSGIPPELADHPRYRIIKKLGQGGMGVVYQAEHRLMERPVALKVIRGKLMKSDVAIERFRLEVKAAARLSHRNIVTAHDAEQAGDLHFLVMEFIEGTELSDIIKRRGKLSVLHACNYAMQTAQGLQHAHEQGMVHRDIKPQNLMRTPKGTIKILDFGLARFVRENSSSDEEGLTNDGATIGTADYIAPEQARDSRRADIRADLYSLGCTLYYMLTGQVPFPEGNQIEKVLAHVQQEPTPIGQLQPDIPAEVEQVVTRMMAKKPNDRYQTPQEIVEALRPFGRPDTSTTNVESSAQQTMMDVGATLSPLEQLDPFDLEQAESQAQPLAQPAFANNPTVPATGPNWKLILGGLAAAVAIVALCFVIPSFLSPNSDIPRNLNNDRPTESGWTDLLATAELNRAVGNWELNDRGELTHTWNSSGPPGARIAFQSPVPEEYDLEVSFTRTAGSDSIVITFVSPQGQAGVEFDAWTLGLSGIQIIDGRDLKDLGNPTRVENHRLTNGQTYRIKLEVRRDSVTVFKDGQHFVTYQGNGSDLSMLNTWDLQNPRALGLGVYRSTATFHYVRVKTHN